jgi:hypothetical protein
VKLTVVLNLSDHSNRLCVNDVCSELAGPSGPAILLTPPR